MSLDETASRYAKALYGVTLLLVLVPLADVAIRSMTGEFGSLQWRFGLVGILFGNLGTVVLGLGLAGLIAALVGNRGTLRGVGFFAILLAVVLVALMALFALDALQMRRLVVAAVKRQVLLSSAGAAASAGMAVIALGMIGRGALVASRSARTPERRTRPAAAPLVAQTAAPAPRARTAESVSESV